MWIEVVTTAHEVGLRSSSTMMYGHVDQPHHWVGHLNVLRGIQDRTGGFTEFVPLPFVHQSSPLYLAGGARPGPTHRDHRAGTALARSVATGHIGRFTRAAFTEKLLGYVAEHGLGELTMRSLGHALGVSHMAVYHHFPGGREELLQVTTDAVLAQIELPEFDGDWIEWLVQTGQRTFDVLSKYRGVAEHVFSRHPVYATSGVVEMIDSIVAKLLSAGLSDVEAVEVWTVCETWLVGQ